jgi:hypothetical protein
MSDDGSYPSDKRATLTAMVRIPGTGVSYSDAHRHTTPAGGRPLLRVIAIEIAAVAGVLWWLFGR